MGSSLGAERVAASRLGLTLDEYRSRRARGLKWCGTCAAWHVVSRFGSDTSRSDGLAASCLLSRCTASDRPGVRERRAMASMGLAWCRECRWWLPATEVYGGLCRPHLRAAERAYYAVTPRRSKRGTNRRMRGIPSWWREEQLAQGCAYCDAPASTLDHFIPVSRGGTTVPGNLVPACKSCNSSKRDADPRLWIARLNDASLERLMWRVGEDGAVAQLDDESEMAA